MADTMRAMGAAGDGVEMTEMPTPTPGPGAVRVKVIASAVNAAEEKVISGDFVGRFLHEDLATRARMGRRRYRRRLR